MPSGHSTQTSVPKIRRRQERRAADLWLQVPMANLPLVKNFKPFHNLRRDVHCLRPGLDRIVRDILAEITVLDVLHRDIQSTHVFILAKEGDKEIRMRVQSAVKDIRGFKIRPGNIRTFCRSINAATSFVRGCVLAMTFAARGSIGPFSRCAGAQLPVVHPASGRAPRSTEPRALLKVRLNCAMRHTAFGEFGIQVVTVKLY